MRIFPTEKHLTEFSGDKFGYENLSKKILDEILVKMELPNCFGLYGNWGSGKSTLIHYLKKHLEEEYSSIKAVYFEPWKYEYSEQKDLLFALLNCIKKAKNIDKKLLKKLAINASVIASGVLRQTLQFNIQDTIEDFKTLEEKAFKEHERWIDAVESFREDFQKLVNSTLKKTKAEKLIIFIDDLDRCLPENSVKLLEGIKNFLSVENVLFVLAIDRRIISEMIEKKYGLHCGYGSEYLIKIIPYYYELPSNNNNGIIEEILNMHGIEYSKISLTYINRFINKFANEPRIAKHYLYKFCTSLIISNEAIGTLSNYKDDLQLQYLFVASYILARFRNIFSDSNIDIITTHITKCIMHEKMGSGSGINYEQEIAKHNWLEEYDRNSLKIIFMQAINTGKESAPNYAMDRARLSEAMHKLKNFS